MKLSNNIRNRLGLTIIITVGATYIVSILVVGLLINTTEITIQSAQLIRLIIAGIIGFAVWNILKKGKLKEENKNTPNHSSDPT